MLTWSTTHTPLELSDSQNHLAFIDSQASNFVVPAVEFLFRVTDYQPQAYIDTANGRTRPSHIGVARFVLVDDAGSSHIFDVQDVWVLPSCERILYSQSSMRALGVTHRLDEGYILLQGGERKTVHAPSYSVELTFLRPNALAARSMGIPLPHNIATRSLGADTRGGVPQQLLWSRLGFPSRDIWLRVADVTVDHGLPGATHLKHNFPVLWSRSLVLELVCYHSTVLEIQMIYLLRGR